MENEIFNELNRLGVCYEYPSLVGFVVFVDRVSGDTVVYAEGFEIKADAVVLETLRRLPEKAGFSAVCEALEPLERLHK